MTKLKAFSTLCAASALALAAGMANAATIQITGISGTWSNWTGGSNVTNTAPGADPAQLRWGNKAPGTQSGYDFDATDTPFTKDHDQEFNLGEFKHLNYVIPTNTSITGADLSVVFKFILDGETTERELTSVFRFAHWETTNDARPCADGGTNGQGINKDGCADQVTVSTILGDNSTIMLDDGDGNWREYAFDIYGFKLAPGANTISEFWTRENKTNAANLYARFTYAENINTGPSPVPLPAAGFLLLGGLGALGALSRRRKTA